MKLLLDTHIWLWTLLDPGKLSKRVAEALRSEENELWLSPISIWEFLLLTEKKRIAIEQDSRKWLAHAVRNIPAKDAALTWEVILEMYKFSLPHDDPADRFLVATARVFHLTLVTADTRLIRSKTVSVLANR